MKRVISIITLLILTVPALAFAQEATAHAGSLGGGIGAGLAIGLAAFGGALGQGKAISASLDSIGRNPSAAGTLFTPMILGLVFVETLVIFSFVIALQLVGKA